MSPTTILALALVIGAVLGTFSRGWASASFSSPFEKKLMIEVLGNGILALLIPYAGSIPGVGEMLDVSKLPPIPAGALMYLVASGSGDFFGNIRKKFTGGT